jgi:hypothetical protein
VEAIVVYRRPDGSWTAKRGSVVVRRWTGPSRSGRAVQEDSSVEAHCALLEAEARGRQDQGNKGGA